MMVSAWWLLAAFIVGGYAGILVVALMRFASSDTGTSPSIGSADVGLVSWLGRDQGHSPL